MTEAKPKKHPLPRQRMTARRKVLWALVATNVLGIPAAIALPSQFARVDPLETAINELGFYPTRPPTLLRRPGSLFLVGLDGIIRTVCEAEVPDDTMKESASTIMAADTLQNANYAFDGQIANRMNAQLGARRVESVRYELSDVKVLEIPGDQLVSIRNAMQSKPNCATAIEQLVNSREFVCQGVSVLLASAKYTVEVDSHRSASGEMSTDNAISDALRRTTPDMAAAAQIRKDADASARSTGDAGEHTITLTSGEGLDYGVKLNELCIAPLEATTPRRLPRNAIERVIYKVWQLSPI
jgi:hypothetical protein